MLIDFPFGAKEGLITQIVVAKRFSIAVCHVPCLCRSVLDLKVLMLETEWFLPHCRW